ncbi:MAG: amidohydrolase family protein [Polyangiaceae bacterium]|nr:amidohydrolase family protein [Polyangiaceae bacterium]
MLIRNAEVARERQDLRIANGVITELDTSLSAAPNETVLEADGGALIVGLHDHHIHLMALAAARNSVACGPERLADEADLANALGMATPGASGWIRGVQYHESVAGPLDRDRLDAICSHAPLRLQHRSGALWMLNSLALEVLALDGQGDLPGLERINGRVSGRIFRSDDWLRSQLGWPKVEVSLSDVGRQLSSYGVTGVTDTTPHNALRELQLFSSEMASGALPQRLVAMGVAELGSRIPVPPFVVLGAVKLLLDEDRLPSLDELTATIRTVHKDRRQVAIHCVTRTELVFATAAFAAAGVIRGDRLEHAAVAPPDALKLVAASPLTIVTQPQFIRQRGDQYLEDVSPADQPWLYRCQGWLEAGVHLGGGTDAPFGDADPWVCMQAAVDRKTAKGQCIGAKEALSPEQALALFTTPPACPGGIPRRVQVGVAADLCLMTKPWAKVRDTLDSGDIRMTMVAGRVSFGE